MTADHDSLGMVTYLRERGSVVTGPDLRLLCLRLFRHDGTWLAALHLTVQLHEAALLDGSAYTFTAELWAGVGAPSLRAPRRHLACPVRPGRLHRQRQASRHPQRPPEAVQGRHLARPPGMVLDRPEGRGPEVRARLAGTPARHPLDRHGGTLPVAGPPPPDAQPAGPRT